MKKGILLLLLVSFGVAQAQTLKDALFKGKLKNEAGSMVRKGDDLSSKIDTTQHKTVPDATVNTDLKPASDSAKTATVQDTAAGISAIGDNSNTAATDTATATEATVTPTETAAAPKNNNTIWKFYVDSVITSSKAEMLSSKKVKKGSYYVLVSYGIDTDGQTTVSDVFVSPENSYLQQQVKERLAIDAPKLNPVLNSSGAPRKVTKKYNFTLSKE